MLRISAGFSLTRKDSASSALSAVRFYTKFPTYSSHYVKEHSSCSEVKGKE